MSSTTGTPRQDKSGGSKLPTTPARMAKVISYWEQIFEEQAVVPSIADSESARQASGGGGSDAQQRAVFGVRERTLSFGKVIYTSVSSSGVEERVRITNTGKVPASVRLELTPDGAGGDAGAGSEAAADGVPTPAEAFTLDCDELRVPPFESRYFTVSFHPRAVRSYGCRVRALVQGGGPSPGTAALQFRCQGDGTLPTVSVLAPRSRSGGRDP